MLNGGFKGILQPEFQCFCQTRSIQKPMEREKVERRTGNSEQLSGLTVAGFPNLENSRNTEKSIPFI